MELVHFTPCRRRHVGVARDGEQQGGQGWVLRDQRVEPTAYVTRPEQVNQIVHVFGIVELKCIRALVERHCRPELLLQRSDQHGHVCVRVDRLRGRLCGPAHLLAQRDAAILLDHLPDFF
jgi:hypothetical protein